MKSINPSKAPGIDNLSGKFLRDCAHILARLISQLCNLSLQTPYQDVAKLLKLNLFKKGSKTNPQNYCPISLLPLLSKIIERIVHDQMFDTMDHQILLKKMKYLGFSENTITWFKSYICEWKFKISINTFTPVLSTYYVEFLKDLF